MAKNLQIDNSIGATAQPVKDQDGNATTLALSNNNVSIGSPAQIYGRLMIADGGVPLAFQETDVPTHQGGLWRMPLDAGILRFDVNTGSAGQEFGSNYRTPLAMTKEGNVLIGADIPAPSYGTLTIYNAAVPLAFREKDVPIDQGGLWRMPLDAGVLRFDVNIGSAGQEFGNNYRTPLAMSKDGVTVRGDVEVTGDIRLLNADCAEDFDICETDLAEPGTVMVLGEDGKLQQSQHAYDKRVAGVISGAGDYKPGIVLDKKETGNIRKPVALLGKVFCKVDASFGTIEIGDLLTTSDTPGHAMKAGDPMKAFGTVIGKALRPLAEGRGLIQVLIALQ